MVSLILVLLSSHINKENTKVAAMVHPRRKKTKVITFYYNITEKQSQPFFSRIFLSWRFHSRIFLS